MKSLAACVAVSAVLALLAAVLDHGAAGVSPALVKSAGHAYFALLLGAPLLIYPVAWREGWSLPARAGFALTPGFLWWLSEIPMRLAWHSLPEALWLAASPLNLAHLYLSLVALVLADLGCRAARALGGGRLGVRGRPALAIAAGLALGPIVVLGSIPLFLTGYQTLFQRDLLPMPGTLPGPLPPGSAVRADPSQRPPNVVFILSDDHRWDFAGYEGHPFVETPSLDRLAAEGVRFSRAYVTSSLCSPSRASFLTGSYPHRHGVWNNFTPWSDENRTFLEYLSQAGYATAFIGKWHMPGKLPELRGVDHFVTFTTFGGQGIYEWCPLVVDGRDEESRTRYIATELTDRALEWLDTQHDRPFALYLSHKSVHADFTPDEPERDLYAEEPVQIPPGSHVWSVMTDAQYVHLNLRPLDASVRRYAAAVASLDREIGRVLDYLASHGLDENTIVIYTSDNGYLWGEHGLVDKRWAYEESIRIPFLLRYPAAGYASGTSRDALIANVDVAPTLLDLAGIAIPERMQGRSLTPLLRDPGAAVRDELFYVYYDEPPYPTPSLRALVTPRHKYVEYDRHPAQLFDLRADPREQHDRAAHDPATAAALAARLHTLADAVAR